ncbi:hypothetical protein [Arthrobacter methylotrophus]|uniref:PBP domain-containing protein n=1 Tax=Arthrobacter methylotrophus TaxID=121291 RepID=A0ABV5UNX5_9MICC
MPLPWNTRRVHTGTRQRRAGRWASPLAATAAMGALLLLSLPPGSAAPAVPGTDWGPAGSMVSDTAATVAWDNTNNAPDSTVPRGAQQQLPHTAGKSYNDVDKRLRDAAAAAFGPGNGRTGLSLTVSQTRNLQNQSVTVSFSGADPAAGANGASTSYLQVFQCWGKPGADNKPDPAATEPDPATCQFGATGLDGDISNTAHQRSLLNDPLVRGGDWEAADPVSPTMNLPAPFKAVTGEQTRIADGFNLSEYRNPFFNRTTTNEFSRFLSSEQGSGSRTFEVQSGAEASGLGCGHRPDAPSVAKCWLVAVPRTAAMDAILPAGPLAPSLWAMRLQVPLQFQDVAAVCPTDQAATLSVGSEALSAAMKSWIPAVCDTKKFTLGFSPLADLQARTQLQQPDTLAFITRPAPANVNALYVPTALAGVVIAMTIDNACTASFTPYTLADCGYRDKAEWEADKARSAGLVRDLKLNARLLAKLLTQSYVQHTAPAAAADAPFTKPGSTSYGQPMTYSIQNDPEFRSLNPKGLGSSGNVSPPVVEGLRSDAAAAVWDWLLNDKDARAFLNGCPDPSGMTINPFYSTRSYGECQEQATTLDQLAGRKISETKTPDGFTYAPVSYPSEGAAYPQVYWAQGQAIRNGDGTIDQPALTVGDQYARVQDMAAAAQNTVRAQPAATTAWCADCSPPAYKSVPRQEYGSRSILSITDAASAAKFQLPTAQLCNVSGAQCIGATTASMQAAAAQFESTEVPGVARPAAAPDYAKAYPLTLPIYGAVNLASVSQTQAATFARLFSYISTEGQKPGFSSGMLPPGYAPLTPPLLQLAATGIQKLQSVSGPQQTEPATTQLLPVESGTSGNVSSTMPVTAGSISATTDAVPAAAPAAGPAPAAAIVPGRTASTSSAWPQYTLAIGLAAALASAAAAPLLARGRRK